MLVKKLVNANQLDLLSEDYEGPLTVEARYNTLIEAQDAIIDIAGTTDLHYFIP
jgi:hypothetical protein